ncbi:SDR family oxidoreductase [Vibrio fortis]|nr:SDR family oxidoreductase [Vibrio fortis]
MKKVLVLGSTGLVGSALVEKLKGSAEVVKQHSYNS